MIEQFDDNMVKIHDVLIPATCIQVDGFPGFTQHDFEDKPRWYPIYFVIMFEDGTLWEVTCGQEEEHPHKIELGIWYNYNRNEGKEPDKRLSWGRKDEPNWKSLLHLYDVHLTQMMLAFEEVDLNEV